MGENGLFRIGLSMLTAAIVFSFFPIGVLSFWIFLAQDNLVSGDDLLSLRRAVIAFMGTGAVIGFIVAITQVGPFRAIVWGLLVSLILMVTLAIASGAELSENAVLGAVTLFLLPGIVSGAVSGWLSRRMARTSLG